MSRARSRTADSTEVKKSKSGLPRRLNEKIALIKEKEQAQSKQFEQAMMSIFEMQQARLHGGGGSMPSLQAIDAAPSYNPPPPPYMPNMVTSTYHTPPTPMSPNTSNQQPANSPGRHMALGRAQSCDSPAGDCPTNTSRQPHYSQLWNVTGEWDNDLSRHKSDSDLQQSILMEQQHICRMNGQQQQMFTPPNVHLSPQHYSSSGTQQHHLTVHQQNGNPLQLDMSFQEPNPANKRPTSMTAALLSPEQFPTNDSPTFGNLSSQTAASSLPDLTNMEFSCGLDVPLERDDDSPTIPKHSFFQHPGPSKLTTSIQANGVPFQQQQQQQQYSATQPYRHHHHHQQQNVFFGSVSSAHYSPPHSLHQQHKLRSLVPASSSSLSPLSLETTASGTSASSALFYNNNPNVQSHHQKMSEVQAPSFVLSPPPVNQDSHTLFPQASNHSPSLRGSAYQQQQQPQFSSFDDSVLLGSSQQPHIRQQQQHGSHFDNLQHQHQRLALQQRLASISMVNTPIRSHSEENLVKMQREILNNDIGMPMGQNPFMGNLANASSVPCVYVEPSNVEPCVDQDDSPTTGTGSPSTSASHASSPPMSRPSWIDQPHSMQEFVFHEWPVDSQGQFLGEKVKLGSPLSHHKSLTELNKLASEVMMDLSSNYQNKNHQLSLPSIVMSDLTVDEQQAHGGFLPQDLAMEDEVMQTFLADGSFAPFMLSGENSLPEPVDLFHDRLNF